MEHHNNPNKNATIHVQIGDAMDARLGELARYHGRGKSAEVRRALAIHDAQSTLAYLQTPEAEVELGPEELERAKGVVKEDLADLISTTYSRPGLPPGYEPSMN